MVRGEQVKQADKHSEVGIYKRKQENTLSTKKVIIERKHALDAESDQEK